MNKKIQLHFHCPEETKRDLLSSLLTLKRHAKRRGITFGTMLTRAIVKEARAINRRAK